MSINAESIESRTGKFNRKVAALVLATFSLVSSCDNNPNYAEGVEQPATPANHDPINKEQITSFDGARNHTVFYYQNGTRSIVIEDPYGTNLARINQFCDGGDLLEDYFKPLGRATVGSMSRSVGHQACEDGMLTPEDFQLEIQSE